MSLRTLAGAPREQFGREVQWRPRDAPAGPRLLLDHLARTEVHQDQAPAGLAHHVLCLDVAVHQSRPVNGGKCAAQLAPDQRGFARPERSLGRSSASSVRPSMNSIQSPTRPSWTSAPYTVTTLGWRTRASTRAFVKDAGRLLFCRTSAGVAQQLQRHVAMQRVAGAVDVPERPLADLLNELERAPVAKAGRARGGRRVGGHERQRRLVHRLGAAERGDAGDDPQVTQHAPMLIAAGLELPGLPIHVVAIGDRRGQVLDCEIGHPLLRDRADCGLHASGSRPAQP